MSDIMIEVTRGPLVECIHRGSAAVADVDGNLRYYAGNPEMVSYLRSAAKPLQAIPVIETGAADRFGLDEPELALLCASHNSEQQHLDMVASILAKIGLDEKALLCGGHAPMDRSAAEILIRENRKPTSIYSNCSGKHSGMLAICRHLGFPVEEYTSPDHPVQKLIVRTMAEICGMSGEDISIGVDGCGVPVFGMPVRNMALGFARLANPRGVSEARAGAARRLTSAMQAYPYLVAGRKRFCTELMQAFKGRLVAKNGAEGVYCAGVLPCDGRPGLGIAVKIEDGSLKAAYAAMGEILLQTGVLSPDEEAIIRARHRPPVKNTRGEICGEFRPVFKLRTA